MEGTTPAQPVVGQRVVVQFGAADRTFTRCEVLAGTHTLDLRPLDPLSGTGERGEACRVVFAHGAESHWMNAIHVATATAGLVQLVAERRRHRRFPLDLVIDLVVGGESSVVHGVLLDLSRGGLQARFDDSLPGGLHASFKLTDPPHNSVRVTGEVIDSAAERQPARVRFLGMSDQHRANLDALLARRVSEGLKRTDW